MSFGSAVELSAAMPLSWLPVIGDYIKNAAQPKKASAVSCITYFIVSCWMFIIGMGTSIYAGESDIAAVLMKAGMGTVALLIVIFSTVTTTFLDVYSAGISAGSISRVFKNKITMTVICLLAALLAVVYSIGNLENFLYFIGFVFTPMLAVMAADAFVLKKNSRDRALNLQNLILWFIGFVIYRILMNFDLVLGNTLPAMLCTFIICIAVGKAKEHMAE